ncbi:MIP/aquaporin family protein [Hoylesella oralis]|uniref:MIP/aquaporin family protein n=1 Tax=Hoylesella oralis TaxID=28134 RepID=UPI0028E4C5C5|nr:MIP/aquaporin family protein [Hoylesella oralis]
MDTILFHNCALELLGTFIMILIGDGVVACVSLNKSKGQGAGWITITIAWGLAVMCGIFIAHGSGAHLNPAVSIGLALAGMFKWGYVIPYIIAQLFGAFLAAITVYLFYKDHFDITEDKMTKLTIFCTMPAITGHQKRNLFCEIMGTFVLLLLIIAIAQNNYPVSAGNASMNLGGIGAFPVSYVIIAIGMSLGGTTGYAINPARDLGPRIAHAFLPIKEKGSSGWNYSWVPIVGPIAGASLAAFIGFIFNLCSFL